MDDEKFDLNSRIWVWFNSVLSYDNIIAHDFLNEIDGCATFADVIIGLADRCPLSDFLGDTLIGSSSLLSKIADLCDVDLDTALGLWEYASGEDIDQFDKEGILHMIDAAKKAEGIEPYVSQAGPNGGVDDGEDLRAGGPVSEGDPWRDGMVAQVAGLMEQVVDLDASLSMICRGDREKAGTFTVKPGTYEPIMGIYDPINGCGGTAGIELDTDFDIDPRDIKYTMMEPRGGKWESDRIDLYTPQDCFGFSEPFAGRIEYSEKKPKIAAKAKPDPADLGRRASVAAGATIRDGVDGGGIKL